ncbi:MAG: hypothetical protein ACKO0M_15360 [Cyanobium sp.]
MAEPLRRSALGLLLALSPAVAAQGQTRWEPLPEPAASVPGPASPTWQPLTQPQPPANASPGVVWQALGPEDPAARIPQVVWQPLNGDPAVALTQPAAPPLNTAQAEQMRRALWPGPDDYAPLLRLGPGVPTAFQVGDQQGQISLYQLSPVGGGGNAAGTGNQNYLGRFDLGLSERLQLSGFYSEADDPLFAPINGKTPTPANLWQSYGGALQLQLLNSDRWKLGLAGSLEVWNVSSGGCDSFSCKSNSNAASLSPNIFNNSGQRVFTRNLVGSVALPLTWRATRTLGLTFTPGVSLLPPTQGAGQGGSGTFYGTNLTLAAGASWRPIPPITLFGSGLLPLGPGTNSFNSDLQFQRVPILTGGVNLALNPRISLEATLTNGFGGTPATAVLALPSDNQLMYMARLVWNPTARDTPELPFTPRSRSLTLGGLSVNLAPVPPAGVVNLWANADSAGNLFGQVAWSASNDFQFLLVDAGAFRGVTPLTPLVSTYASDGGVNLRVGGKAVYLQQLRGAPFTAAGSITLGRNTAAASFQGYVYAEAMATWEANRWLALNLNPKLAWSGVDIPVGVGLSANIQLGRSFQLIPELNLVASDAGASNGTLALRWLASPTAAVDLYVSNAAGLYDIGQLLRSAQARLGGKLTLQF